MSAMGIVVLVCISVSTGIRNPFGPSDPSILQSDEITRDTVDKMGDSMRKYKGEAHKDDTWIFPSLFSTLEECTPAASAGNY